MVSTPARVSAATCHAGRLGTGTARTSSIRKSATVGSPLWRNVAAAVSAMAMATTSKRP